MNAFEKRDAPKIHSYGGTATTLVACAFQGPTNYCSHFRGLLVRVVVQLEHLCGVGFTGG